MAVPMSVLTVRALVLASREIPPRWRRVGIPAIALVFVVLLAPQVALIQRYLAGPAYSLRAACRLIRATVDREDHEPVLVGNPANTIGLCTSFASINENMGSRDLEWRVLRYRPDFYNQRPIQLLIGVPNTQSLHDCRPGPRPRPGPRHFYRLVC